jgi:hypothetical protein
MTTTTNPQQFKVGEWELAIDADGEWTLDTRGTVSIGRQDLSPCGAELQRYSAELLKLALELKKAGY